MAICGCRSRWVNQMVGGVVPVEGSGCGSGPARQPRHKFMDRADVSAGVGGNI